MRKKARLIISAAVALVLLLTGIIWLAADRSDRVGICYCDSDTPYNAAYRKQLSQALTAQGFEVVITDADGDHAKQIQHITELAKKKCDVLLIEPVMYDATEELLAAIDCTELPAILLDRQIDTALLNNHPRIAYMGYQEEQSGQLQAQMMQELPDSGDLNGDGMISYILIQGEQNLQNAKARTDSFENAVQSAKLEVQQLAKISGDGSLESGRRICKEQLAIYGKDIEIIVCGDDQMAIGAAEAIADGGRTVGKNVYLLAIGGRAELLNMVNEGKISGTVHHNIPVKIDTIVKNTLAISARSP